MLNATSAPDVQPIDQRSTHPACGLVALRDRQIRSPDDYGIELPPWLRECINHVPPGIGHSCPTDSEALLAAAFDFAFQLHEGQFRASCDPYIVHPVAVADLLRDIGASASVIAASFLHDVVEDTDVTPEQLESHFGPEVRELVEGVTKLGGLHFTRCFWPWPATSALCW